MKLSVLLKQIFFVSLKSTKSTSKTQISEVCDLGHVGHMTYGFINILLISTGIFGDKLRPHILSVGTTANSPLTEKKMTIKFSAFITWNQVFD